MAYILPAGHQCEACGQPLPRFTSLESARDARPCPKCDPPPVLTCCGQPMIYQECFGVRRYQCDHRAHHPAIYVNQNTGERVTDEDLPWGRP